MVSLENSVAEASSTGLYDQWIKGEHRDHQTTTGKARAEHEPQVITFSGWSPNLFLSIQ